MESAVDIQVLADSLVGGADTRLLLDDDGLSKYGGAPFPRNTIPFGSCMASTMSLRAWEAAQAGVVRIKHILKERSSVDVADTLCAEIGDCLADLLGLSDVPGAEVVLTPSGTDVELIALLTIGDDADRAVLNIVVGPNEVGSGTTPAAGARHFDNQVPSGVRREVDQALDERLGWLDHHLALLSDKMTLMAERWTDLYSPENA